MLIDSHEHEDIFARVPELADQTDPVLRRLDALLDDDVLYGTVRADLGRRVRTVLSSSSSAFPAFPCRTWSPRVRYAPKECIALAARGVAVLRRNDCMPCWTGTPQAGPRTVAGAPNLETSDSRGNASAASRRE